MEKGEGEKIDIFIVNAMKCKHSPRDVYTHE